MKEIEFFNQRSIEYGTRQSMVLTLIGKDGILMDSIGFFFHMKSPKFSFLSLKYKKGQFDWIAYGKLIKKKKKKTE